MCVKGVVVLLQGAYALCCQLPVDVAVCGGELCYGSFGFYGQARF
jgi:hypothetical protein